MNIITREFEGHAVHTFSWNGKPCWIASEIVSLFGYADNSVTIRQCIEAEDFEPGVEYNVLSGKALSRFKTMVHGLTKDTLVSQHTRNLTIFYEDGLYGFLQYTEKPVGVCFRKWIRSEVVPSIRQTGTYAIAETKPLKQITPQNNKTPEASLPSVNNAARIMLKAMADARVPEQERLKVLADLYRQAGITMDISTALRVSAPHSPRANALNETSLEALKLSRIMAPEDIDAYILEVLASENRPLAKKLAVLIMEAAKQGKPVHFS